MKYFTGIGSRRTPTEYLVILEEISRWVVSKYTLRLRSGHAVGADRACEIGADGFADIYLPWKNYGTKPYKDDPGMPVLGSSIVPPHDAYKEELAMLICNKLKRVEYNSLSFGVKKLVYRNMFQILGHEQPPIESLFVLCYMSDQGGTGYAVALAEHLQIPVINVLYKDSSLIKKNIKGIIDNN